MKEVQAKLSIILKAGEETVATSHDVALWQQTLAQIIKPTSTEDATEREKLPAPADARPAHGGLDPVASLARRLGVSTAEVMGAISPSTEAPYLILNVHNWEAMRKTLPRRGPGALSRMGAAATLLALWFHEAKLGTPTQAQALKVLESVNENDHNPARGINTTSWLAARNQGSFVLNPAEVSAAENFARTFCSKQWPDKA